MYTTDDLPSRYTRLITMTSRDPRRAVLCARRRYAQTDSADGQEHAWASYTLGWTLLQWERWTEAAPFLQQALEYFQHHQHLLPSLHCRHALLLIRARSAPTEVLLTDWAELADAYAAAGDRLAAARVRLYQIRQLHLSDQAQAALALARQIAPQLQAGTGLDQGALARQMAVSSRATGDLESARTHIETALRCFAAEQARFEIARCWLERSGIWQRAEDFAAARQDLLQARRVFQHQAMSYLVAICDRDLGLIASRLGQYDQALTLTLQARAQLLALGHMIPAATCDVNLGIVAHYCGLFDLAWAAYRRAQIVYAAHGRQVMQLVCQRNQALMLLAQAQPAAALALLTTLEQPFQELNQQSELAEMMLAQALAQRDLEHYDDARALFQRAHDLFLTLDIRPAAARCLLEQAWLDLDQGAALVAQHRVAQAQPLLEQRPIHAWRIAYGFARCAELRGDPQTALAYYQTAGAIVAELRHRLADELASSGQFVLAQSLFAAALRLAADQHQPESIVRLAEQQRALALQRQLTTGPFYIPPDQQPAYAELQATLRRLLNNRAISKQTSDAMLDRAVTDYSHLLLQARHIAPLPTTTPTVSLDLVALRQQWTAAFPAGWLALVYVWQGDELLLVTLTAHDMLLTRQTVDTATQHLFERIRSPRYHMLTYLDLPHQSGQTDRPWSDLTTLADLLLPAAVRVQLQPDQRLLIVPAGELHGVPWAALRVDNAWLCERAIIQLLPGLAAWPTLAARTPQSNAALLVGCHTFAGRAPDLPHVPAMLDRMAAGWPGQVTRLEGLAATCAALRNLADRGALRSYGMLCIATHAQMHTRHGLLAHLKLGDDDLLLDEVARLTLDGALVVLATCDGAFGAVLPGEEVMSLSRAFLVAGAGDVLASLWQLYDRAIAGVMTALVAALNAGHDVPTALAYAQRTCIATGQYATSESQQLIGMPLVWASLCVIGGGTARPAVGGTTSH